MQKSEDIYNQFKVTHPPSVDFPGGVNITINIDIPHINYACDLPSWFVDNYNNMIDIINALQRRVGNT